MNIFPTIGARPKAVQKHPVASSIFGFSIIKLLCGLLVLVTGLSVRAQITEFPILTGSADPQGITLGPDGAYWFTEFQFSGSVPGRIGRIDTNGVVTEPFIFLTNTSPVTIIVGPDTNLWFTEFSVDKIGRISRGTNGSFTNGILTEFPIHPGTNTNSAPTGLTVGPDNNLWFLEYNPSLVGVMDTNGTLLHEYGTGLFPSNSQFFNIVTGPDNNLWFTDYTYGKIARITTAGVITQFPLPFTNSEPYDIIVGSDNALWFSEFNSNRIGRITTGGSITEFILPTTNPSQTFNFSQDPMELTLGKDGNIWFTEYAGGNIGRITPAGVITEFPTSFSSSRPTAITAGPDGSLWFCESVANAIGRFFVPTLTITTNTNSQVVLSWPAITTGFTLQGNTNLNTTNWVNLTSPPPVIVSNLFLYTNNTVGAEFFRLIH